MVDFLSSFEKDLNIAVIGAHGDIGSAFVQILCNLDKVKAVYTFSRSDPIFNHKKMLYCSINIIDEDSIAKAIKIIEEPLDIIIVATGFLHDKNIKPEKSLHDITMESLEKNFSINIFGPALIAKYFVPKLIRDRKSVFAALSARVGSISDNEIGGWYSYRASKASLNMLIKTTSIEAARRYKKSAIIGLHPGTVDTKLSKPYQNNISHSLFSPNQSAEYLLEVINKVSSVDSGKVFSWDGKEIPS